MAELAGELSLARIVEGDYDCLRLTLAPVFWHVRARRIWRWKLNALNAMSHHYAKEYKPSMERALNDPEEKVRIMARRVAEKHF